MSRVPTGSSVISDGTDDRFRLTPIVAGLLAITVLSAVAAAAVMCALRVRSRRHRNHQDSCGIGTGSLIVGGGGGGGTAVIAVCKQKANDGNYAAAASDPDKNPDLIPPTKIKSEYLLVLKKYYRPRSVFGFNGFKNAEKYLIFFFSIDHIILTCIILYNKTQFYNLYSFKLVAKLLIYVIIILYKF